jgi:hypothetical protein
MRYDDWDVILFPKDSHIPIQEFKTACYASPEECEYRALTLPTYKHLLQVIDVGANSMQMEASYLR